MTIIFGLLSAFSYGYADFVGALAAKRVRAISVTTISFSFGLLIALVLSIPIGANYSPAAISTGIYAGVASGIAISCLYAALALGPISIVSPLTAVISAVIPVLFDLATGTQLGPYSILAIVLVLIAVVLVAFVPGPDVRLPSLRAMVFSVGSGLGFAGIFVFLDSAPSDSGLSTLVVMRVVGIALMLLGLSYLFFTSKPAHFLEPQLFSKSLVWLVLLAGSGDVLGNVAFLVATRAGDLAVAAVLTSLYPVGTILLARIVLKERIAKSQTVGIFLAMAACGLLAMN
ncbi:EamA family transporter [Aquiluna borgnonia]|uniref:EamA family transporter n=1 Tax=Aquiluna borgnonia TaxID=2499157 RepID=A0A7D4PR61_9MICO|nr:EamA family transporter [Aquiluna borgnonia]QKJ25806.1 EamA family transporter [Aquiluna borgnonia]